MAGGSLDSLDRENIRVSMAGVAPASTREYDSPMIIKTAADLHDWCRSQAADQTRELDAAAAHHAVECIASVVWRHAIGQGLRLGDDWVWVLGLYDAAAIREIVEAAADSAAADRRRRGF